MTKKAYRFMGSKMDIEFLQEKFMNSRGRYSEIKKESEQKVVRWEWYTDDFYSIQPYFFEQNLWKKGKKLKNEPSSKTDKCQYGFDADGRMIAIRQYTEFKNSFFEEFFEYFNKRIESVLYHYGEDKRVISIKIYQFANTKIDSMIRCDENGYSHENYEYEDDRLTAIKHYRENTYESMTSVKYGKNGMPEYLEQEWIDHKKLLRRVTINELKEDHFLILKDRVINTEGLTIQALKELEKNG
jgi:hypothetical protein